ALGKIKDGHAVDALIIGLNDRDLTVRYRSAQSIGELKDPRAVDSLSMALAGNKPDQYVDVWRHHESGTVRSMIAYALESIGNAPAKEKLLEALRNSDAEVVAGAYRFFIRRGNQDAESALVRGLERYGTKEMALDYLNCGNSLLVREGEIWARRH